MVVKSDEDIKEIFGEAINNIKEAKDNLNDPDSFNFSINYKINQGIKLLANSLHEPSICKDKYKPDFIYLNYAFLEQNIKQLCILKEGSCCCVDKSRSIIEMYLEYSISGQVQEFKPDIEKWWLPKFGTYQDWMDFCDGLYNLYYGQVEKYFRSYNTLIQAEKRKYKHILHTWYIKFKDGEIVKVSNSWDDKQDNPLENKYNDKGHYYVVTGEKLKNRGYEKYKKFIHINHYKVPKKDIEEIYKVSEEKII